jgi:hypothetical protein
MACRVMSLVHLDVRGLDDLFPLGGLTCHVGGHLLRRTLQRIDPGANQLLSDLGIGDRLHVSVVRFRDDRRRHGRRRNEALPRPGFIARQVLRHRRNAGQPIEFSRRGDGDGLDLLVGELAARRGKADEHYVDLAGDEILQRWRGAAVGHVRELDAGGLGEQRGRQVKRIADTAGGIVNLAARFLGRVDQLSDGGYGQFVGIDKEHDGKAARERDRREVLGRVKGVNGRARNFQSTGLKESGDERSDLSFGIGKNPWLIEEIGECGLAPAAR